MADPIYLPRHDEELDIAVDAYIDICIQLEDATLNPSGYNVEVIQKSYLRLATVIANQVSGISGKYQREVTAC